MVVVVVLGRWWLVEKNGVLMLENVTLHSWLKLEMKKTKGCFFNVNNCLWFKKIRNKTVEEMVNFLFFFPSIGELEGNGQFLLMLKVK